MAPQLASAMSVRRAAAEALGLEGLTLRDLARQLVAQGIELGPEPADRLLELLDTHSDFMELDEERWYSVRDQLRGLSFTTWLDADDADEDVLPLSNDLTLLGWLTIDGELRAATGEPLVETETLDGREGLGGPEGWLTDLGGQLVAVSVEGDVVRVEPRPGPPPPVSEAQVAALRLSFDAHAVHDELRTGLHGGEQVTFVTVLLEELWWEALVASREAFTGGPVPPIEAIAAEAGLEVHEITVGEGGTDWAAFERCRYRKQLAHVHKLDGDGLDSAERLIEAIDAAFASVEELVAREIARASEIDEEPEPPATAESVPPFEPAVARQLCNDLDAPGVAPAVWGHYLASRREPVVIGLFTMRVIEGGATPDSATDSEISPAGGAHWLAGKALDHTGRPLEAEAAHRLAATAGYGPAYASLAAFAADRGDAKAAFDLLRLAGAEDDDALVTEVRGYATYRPQAVVGRNERCPCGSGRKYKACHLGKESVPLIDRGPWLYDKACRYLRDNRWRWFVTDIARTISEASGRGGFFLLELLDSEPVADLVLCEGGVFENFLAERDGLLPEDEALTAAQWQLHQRSLFETVAVTDDTITLRDVRSGDRVTVTNTHGDANTRPGMYFMGRPLPIADTWRSYSGLIRIPDMLREDALAALDDADPYAIAEIFGRSLAPPAMRNTDGEELVFHDLTYRLDNVADAAAALAGELNGEPSDTQFTLVRDSVNQANTVILTFTIDGATLRVSANSDPRLEEARALVARLLPDATLVDHDVRELDEMLAQVEAPSSQGASRGPGSTAGSGGAFGAASGPAAIPGRTSKRAGGLALPGKEAVPFNLPDDPELDAIVSQLVGEYEERWLDEPVPALGGLTPREAADDPIGRVELERLLNTWPEDTQGGKMMSPARLRVALGL